MIPLLIVPLFLLGSQCGDFDQLVDAICASHPDLPQCGLDNSVAFVTSTRQGAALGGLSGADKICNDLASASPLAGKSFVAWLSTSTVDAKDRLVEPRVAFVRPDGVVVANSIADLTDGTLDNPITLDENGAIPNTSTVYTATGANGNVNLSFGATTCSDWTAASGAQVFEGIRTRTNTGWTSALRTLCSNQLRLYCFEVP